MASKKCLKCLDDLKSEYTYKNIFRVFHSHGDKAIIQYTLDKEIVKLSYSDFEFPCEYCADKLHDILAGSEKGYVCLKLTNCPEWFAIFWGLLIAGYKPFLIDFRHDKEKTEFFISQTNAVAIIHNDKETYDGCKNILAGDIISLDRKTILDIAKNADKTSQTFEERISKYDFEDEILLCTSGTTSTAKIYAYNGLAMCNQMECAREIVLKNDLILSDKPTRTLIFLPLNHIFGFVVNHMWYSLFGATGVIPEKMAPSVLLSTCREHEVTNINAVPLLVNNIASGLSRKIAKEPPKTQKMFRAVTSVGLFIQRINPTFGIWLTKKLLKKSVLDQLCGPSLRCIICGGGHLLPESAKLINSIGYYTVCGFGMTEVGISSVELRKSVHGRLGGFVGTPVSAMEYKIVPLSENNPNIGELKMRGKNIHSAVIRDGQKFPPNVDENGWYASGDIGRLVKNDLIIEGRLKEIIVNESGENVYPDEVEDTFKDLPDVKQFTVLGVKKPDSPKYEDIVLVCQVSNTDNAEKNEELRLMIANANKNLPVYKKLDYALITADEMPLSNGIKIKRLTLKKMIEDGEGNFVKFEKVR